MTGARKAADLGHPPYFTHLVLKPTLRCTARCATCSSRQELHRQQRRDVQLGLDDWRRLFDEVEALGNQRLTLSGGEPLLVPELAQLIEEGKRRGWRVGLNTNGSLASESMVQRLLVAGLDTVMLSMYSATPAIHDSMRSHPGLWDKACAAVRRFRQQAEAQGRALSVNLQTLLCRENYRQFPNLLELAAELGVDGVLFSYLEGDFEQRVQLLDEDSLREFDTQIRPRAVQVLEREISDPWTRRVAIARLRGLYPGLHQRWAAYARGEYRAAWPCPTPSHFSIVLASGDVHPCNMVEYSHRPVIGNLRERRFTELWRGEAWATFRSSGFDLCRYCPVPLQVYLPLRARPRLAPLEYALARGGWIEQRGRLEHRVRQQLAWFKHGPLFAPVR